LRHLRPRAKSEEEPEDGLEPEEAQHVGWPGNASADLTPLEQSPGHDSNDDLGWQEDPPIRQEHQPMNQQQRRQRRQRSVERPLSMCRNPECFYEAHPEPGFLTS